MCSVFTLERNERMIAISLLIIATGVGAFEWAVVRYGADSRDFDDWRSISR